MQKKFKTVNNAQYTELRLVISPTAEAIPSTARNQKTIVLTYGLRKISAKMMFLSR